MKIDLFTGYLQDSQKLNDESLGELTELVKVYPYCQSARILLTQNLFKEKHIRYDDELKITAVYAGNRKVLKQHIDELSQKPETTALPDEHQETEKLIETNQATPEEIPESKEQIAPEIAKEEKLVNEFDDIPQVEEPVLSKQKTESSPVEDEEQVIEEEAVEEVIEEVSEENKVSLAETVIEPPPVENEKLEKEEETPEKETEKVIEDKELVIPEPEDHPAPLEEEKEDTLTQLKKIVAERLKQIEKAKTKPGTEEQTIDEEPEQDAKRKSAQSISDLIDTFIENEPSISRPKVAFFNPTEAAKESVVDEENIVSETLAKIYFDQKRYQKAIGIYKKLSLKYPEKSSYFAALIEKAIEELKK